MIALSLMTSCDYVEDKVSSGGGSESDSEAIIANPVNATINLNAFTDFRCGSNWTLRDNGMGLVAGTGGGACNASFSGGRGNYRVTLRAQTEYDGAPRYRISINGNIISSGAFPYSKGGLICNCPDWQKNCPDKVVDIDAGTHPIKPGDVIEYFGEEVYPCGKSHGAYAKWRGMVLTPVN